MTSESLWSVYLIRCGDDSLYCGISNDVLRRLSEHSSQGPKCAKYLRGRNPLNLVYERVIGTRAEASSEEYRIKNLSRKSKEFLIAENYLSRWSKDVCLTQSQFGVQT